jgi:uncharacterized protein (DUF58 family)
MRHAIRRLRAGLDGRLGAWIRRRQGTDRDPVVLRRGRIYILPTRLGVAYAAMVVAMVVGALNYSNNLALGLAFLLVGLGFVAMHHCHGNLVGLELRLHSTEPAFAGQEVHIRLVLENRASAPRPGIEVSPAKSMPPQVATVPPAASATAGIALHAERRGYVRLERFVLATRYPLGLFRAWAVVHPGYSAIAWPRPAERGRPPPGVETDTGGAQDRAKGEEDFTGLKAYQPGDPLRRIAWKAYARGRGLHTKQYGGTDVVSHVFDWDSLPGLDVEARLSQLCRWVLDAHESGEAFGLRLPGRVIDANIGTGQLQRCLEALATFDQVNAGA